MMLAVLASFLVLAKQGPIRPGNRFALLIASNPYGQDKSHVSYALPGTETDLKCMRQLLDTIWGFREENIVELRGPEATRNRILKELHWLGARVGPNCYGLVYFSGHGSAVSVSSEVDAHNWLECLVSNDKQPVWNREINEQLVTAKGQITEIFDCCFGGGLGRVLESDNIRCKSLAAASSWRLPQVSRARAEETRVKSYDRRGLFAACTTYSLACEVTINSRSTVPLHIGNFTAALYRAISTWPRKLEMTRRNVGDEISNGGFAPTALVPAAPLGDLSLPFVAPPINAPRDVPVAKGAIPRGLLADESIREHVWDGRGQVRLTDVDWLQSRASTSGRLVSLNGKPRYYTNDPREKPRQVPNPDGDAKVEVVGDIVVFYNQKQSTTGLHNNVIIDSQGTWNTSLRHTHDEAESDRKLIIESNSCLQEIDAIYDNAENSECEPTQVDVSDLNPAIGSKFSLHVEAGKSERKSFLLLTFDPGGDIHVVSDGAKVRLENVVFEAIAPPGPTQVRLLRLDREITVPPELLSAVSRSTNDRCVSPERIKEFLGWIQSRIKESTETSMARIRIQVRPAQ